MTSTDDFDKKLIIQYEKSLKLAYHDLHIAQKINQDARSEIDEYRKMLRRGINENTSHYSSTWEFDVRELLDKEGK